MPLRTRIAPTPSGFLHIGNVCSFVLTWLIARQTGGHLHLRIDDLDADRAKPAFYDDIFQTLDWLGLDVDSGASGTEDCLKNWSQKRRLADYNQALVRLQEKNLLYACGCSRASLADYRRTHTLSGKAADIYPGICRNKNLPLTAPNLAWRAKCSGDEPSKPFAQGDVVVRRRDGIPAYYIASLVDDTLDEISFIIRGEDLRGSTEVQICLAQMLGLEAFGRIDFLHHALVLDENSHKLSKSHGSLSVRAMREQGITKSTVLKRCAEFCGIDTTMIRHDLTLPRLLEHFALADYRRKEGSRAVL